MKFTQLAALIRSKVMNHPVDQLGAIRAQIEILKRKEKRIEDRLKFDPKYGEGQYEGILFRAFVVHTERAATDWKAIAEGFGPSHQLVSAYTKHLDYLSVRLGAKLKGA